MTVLAHKDGTKEQLLACHSYNVAENAREHAKDIDQGHVLFLLGLYHDLGKADPKFQRKLKQEPEMHVDHSYAGARYLFTKAKAKFGHEPFVDIITYVIAALTACLMYTTRQAQLATSCMNDYSSKTDIAIPS